MNDADGNNDYINADVGVGVGVDDEGRKKTNFYIFSLFEKNSLPFKYDLIILELLPLTRH